jgi:hypothetical protein
VSDWQKAVEFKFATIFVKVKYARGRGGHIVMQIKIGKSKRSGKYVSVTTRLRERVETEICTVK